MKRWRIAMFCLVAGVVVITGIVVLWWNNGKTQDTPVLGVSEGTASSGPGSPLAGASSSSSRAPTVPASVPVVGIRDGMQSAQEGPPRLLTPEEIQRKPLVSWRPVPKRTISPEIAGQIDSLISDSIKKLGYDKVGTLQMDVTYKVMQDGTEVAEGKATESYERPGRHTRKVSGAGMSLSELYEGKSAIQVDNQAEPDKSVRIEDRREWYQTRQHPLMLHFELNPNIYETLETRVFGAEDAAVVGSKGSVGHEVAVLKSVSQPLRSHPQQFEVWIDRQNGQVVNVVRYLDGRPVERLQNFEYTEISPGIYYPTLRKRVAEVEHGGSVVMIEKVEHVVANMSIPHSSQ